MSGVVDRSLIEVDWILLDFTVFDLSLIWSTGVDNS